MLTVLEAAKSHDLTLLATVKAELEITDGSMDANLKRYISQASDVVARYCNRTFALETVQETLSQPPGYAPIMLSRYPVVDVLSVTENGTALEVSDYEIDKGSGIILRQRCGISSRWGSGSTKITYTTGYTVPSGLPSGIERATIELVKHYAASGDRDPMIRSESTEGSGSTDYFSGGNNGLPPEVQGLLDPHVRPNG